MRKKRVRVLSWNVHKCIGGVDRLYRPERVAEAIERHAPDVALLQEVDHAASRSNHDRQIDLLGDMLGLKYRAYFPNVSLRKGGEYGNAILSRFPLEASHNIDLTIPPKKRRGAIHTRVRVPRGDRRWTLHVLNVHLGLLGLERKVQLRRILKHDALRRVARRTPILLAGDLNDVYGTLGPRILEPAGFETRQPALRTFPAYAPVRALDAVYVRGLRIHRLFTSPLTVARFASDHLPLIADIEPT